jgi:hypothetical protein
MEYMGEIDASLEEASKRSGEIDEVCYACMDSFMSWRYFYIQRYGFEEEFIFYQSLVMNMRTYFGISTMIEHIYFNFKCLVHFVG